MQDKLVDIDRQKHVLYSAKIKGVILDRLHQRFDDEKADEVWTKIQRKYAEWLRDTPYLGGKKCTHNGVGGTYDCIALFAFYEVLEEKPSLEELYEMNNVVLLPPFQRLGKIVNVDKHPKLLYLINKVFKSVAKADKKLEATCPTGYIMEVEDYDKSKGIRYKFHRCPIAEFAKAHNLTHVMPAMCNGDYPALASIGATLIRNKTCSNGDYCDYQIVSNSDLEVEKHPMYLDDAGYMKNDVDDDIL